eukprot:SM000080S22960  [mRNA]  locus=s80:405846:407221:+ [translate_table: standard]
MVADARAVAGVPTFQIIAAQGVVGSFPWAALSFCTMWLELVGFTHPGTAMLLGFFVVATSAGGLFGGWLGDAAALRLPNTGRIVCAQFSAGSAVPLAALLLYGLPNNASAPLLYAATFVIVGFIISWNASSTNNPIFAEIVPEKLRTNVYALDRAVEGLLASFAPYIVATIAEQWYGWRPVQPGMRAQDAQIADRGNARALAGGLFLCTALPWALCCAIYTLLYHHYPRDRDNARFLSLANGAEHERLEMQLETIREADEEDADNDADSPQ